MTNDDFIKLISNAVCFENKKRGYPLFSSVVIAQAILETGWGKSNMMMKANAVFGIKATANWNGKVFNSKTYEVYDGKIYNITGCFRAYNSIQESVSDYFDLICKSERYRKALVTSSPNECIQAIKDGGYATDPGYVNKIMTIINSWNLTEFDNKVQETNTMYIKGKNYTLQDNMFVRTGAGTNYSIKAVCELTYDGKNHVLINSPLAQAVLKKGTIVTCLDVIEENGNIWLKIPSGYVAGFHKGVTYIK